MNKLRESGIYFIFVYEFFTLIILDTDKQLFWQTMETQMKCCIMGHFTRVCTVCSEENNRQRQKHIIKK